MQRRGLSKSKLLSSLQCSKRLWLEIHRRELLNYSPADEQRFAIGHNVGEAARQLEPGGVLIGSDKNLAQALAETRAQLEAEAKVQERVRRAHVNDAVEFDPAVKKLMREFGYDAEFVALAIAFGVSLVTADKAVLKAFPEQTLTMEAFLEGQRVK